MYAQPQPAVYNPFVANGVNMFEYGHAMRHEIIKQRKEYIAKRLKENFPTKYVIVHCAMLTLSAIVVIAAQIVGIINKSALYVAGSGIWLGAAYLLVMLPIFILCKQEKNFAFFFK